MGYRTLLNLNRTKLAKNAGAVLYLDARKSTGNGLPSNSPLTSPWMDLANVVGKNLFDPLKTISGYLNIVSGGVSPATVGQKMLNYTLISPNSTYTISGGDRTSFGFYDTNKTFISAIDNATITTPENSAYLRVYYSSNGTHTNVQLELGSTATAYEPYKLNNALPTNFAGTTASGVDISDPLRPFWVFDGTDDFFSLINTPSIDITSAPLAVFATVKVNSFAGNNGRIVVKDDVGGKQYAILHANDDSKFEIIVNNISVKTNIVTKGIWYSVGFIWDGATFKAFVNQINNGSSALSGSLTSRPNINIGRQISGTYFSGKLSSLSIYAGANATEANVLKSEKQISKAYIGG